MQKTVLFPDGKRLRLRYWTTHRDRRWYVPHDLYVACLWYNRSDGPASTIMAYQRQQRPSIHQSLWGIYRVEEWPGSFYYPEGNYTLLTGAMTRREALRHLANVVGDDPGHRHFYWTDAGSIQRYREGESRWLTAFCKTCDDWIYDEQVESLTTSGTIEIVPSAWYTNLSNSGQKKRTSSHDKRRAHSTHCAAEPH